MPRIGRSELDVFPLALGGNTFGWTSDETSSHQVLDAFVEQGGNFIDSADGYSGWVDGNTGGESETIIGNWLRSRGNRDQVVIGTKASGALGASDVAAAADASLTRLQTDYIDLYYAHFDDESVPLAETVEAFGTLVREGKVRHVAVSNYSAARIAEWIAIAREGGHALPVAVQPHYNLVHRRPFERETAQLAAEHDLSVVPYFALASGFLTGKYRSKDDLVGSARESFATGYVTDEGLAVVGALDEIASAHASSVATVALAWLHGRPNVVAPIASARTVDQLPDLLAAADLQLTAAETDRLDELSAQVPEQSEN